MIKLRSMTVDAAPVVGSDGKVLTLDNDPRGIPGRCTEGAVYGDRFFSWRKYLD
jgi:hypothetical protein